MPGAKLTPDAAPVERDEAPTRVTGVPPPCKRHLPRDLAQPRVDVQLGADRVTEGRDPALARDRRTW